MQTHPLFLPPLLLLMAGPALAENANANANTGRDEIIVTDSFTPIPADTATSAVSTFSTQDLTLQGPVLLGDLLRDVPGLSVSRSGPQGQMTQVRLRGSEANHVLVMLNGFPANDPFTGGHDFAFDGTSLLSSVEVLRGEQSALWGSGALGGVIDMQSAPAPVRKNGANAFLEAGSFGHVSGQMQFSESDANHALWGGVNALRSDGVDMAGLNGERDGFSALNLMLGTRMQTGENTQVSMLVMGSDGVAEFDSDPDFDGRLEETNDTLSRNTLRVQARLDHVGAGGINYVLGGQYYKNNSNASGTLSRGASKFAFVQANKNWDMGQTRQSVTIRGEMRHLDFNVDAGLNAFQNQQQGEDQWSAAAEYRMVLPKWVVQVSARQDENNLFANAHAVQAGLSWQSPISGGRLRLRYGEGIKNPGFYELFGYFPSTFVGNPALKPERQTGMEAGWEQDLGRAHISLSVFSARLHDEIYTDFAQFPYTAKNRTGASSRKGVELAANWQVTDRLRLRGALTHMRSENDAGQAELRRPEWLTALGADYQSGKWQFNADLDGQSSQLDTDFASYTDVALPGYALLRARLAYEFKPGLSVYVRGQNLLDRNAQQVVGYASQPRTIYGGVAIAL